MELYLGLSQLLISALGIYLIILQIKQSRDDTNKYNKVLDRHIVNLHRSITLLRAVFIMGKTEGEEQPSLIEHVEKVDAELRAYLKEINASDNK